MEGLIKDKYTPLPSEFRSNKKLSPTYLPSRHLNKLADPIGRLPTQSFLIHHLPPDLLPGALQKGDHLETTKYLQTLSSLSTALQMQRNMSVATPQTSNIPSKIFRWFTCSGNVDKSCYIILQLTLMTNLPTSTAVRISLTIFTHSASGIIASYSPAMSKSH